MRTFKQLLVQKNGGVYETRTHDLFDAIEAL